MFDSHFIHGQGSSFIAGNYGGTTERLEWFQFFDKNIVLS